MEEAAAETDEAAVLRVEVTVEAIGVLLCSVLSPLTLAGWAGALVGVPYSCALGGAAPGERPLDGEGEL